MHKGYDARLLSPGFSESQIIELFYHGVQLDSVLVNHKLHFVQQDIVGNGSVSHFQFDDLIIINIFLQRFLFKTMFTDCTIWHQFKQKSCLKMNARFMKVHEQTHSK